MASSLALLKNSRKSYLTLKLSASILWAQSWSYQVEGIGHGFVPNVLKRDLIDVWIKSENTTSFLVSHSLIREESLLCSGSSGAAMYASAQAVEELKDA